jgi:hypothetical protein
MTRPQAKTSKTRPVHPQKIARVSPVAQTQ